MVLCTRCALYGALYGCGMHRVPAALMGLIHAAPRPPALVLLLCQATRCSPAAFAELLSASLPLLPRSPELMPVQFPLWDSVNRDNVAESFAPGVHDT